MRRIDVSIEERGASWLAIVQVDQDGRRTEHRVTVARKDMQRYGAADASDLVRRSFDFLLEREPNISILREFRITDIERYFPEFAEAIGRAEPE